MPTHADTTPSQVPTFAGRAVLLTDFDRARMGATSLDIASHMVSAGPECAEVFVHGHEWVGGRLPTGTELSAVRVHTRTLKFADPLRRARPDWAQHTDHTLTLIEEESACL